MRTMVAFDELHLINLISVLLIAIAVGLPANPLRIALGLPFILLCPGYALLAAVYPRRGELGLSARLALSAALSLAVVPLIGLLVNSLPWGARLGPILVSVAVFIALCSALAERTRTRLPRAERFSIEIVPLWAQVRGLPSHQLVIGGGLITAIVFAGWLTHVTHSHEGETFTEFYVLDASGNANYPDQVLVGQSMHVMLGITNHERRRAAYTITVRENGRVLAALDPVTLDDGQRWQRSASIRLVESTGRQRVDFLLNKDGGPAPYRDVHLWLTVAPR